MACLIYKEEVKRLGKCLIKMVLGKTTNGITCLNMHKKLLEVQGKAEAEVIKWKTTETASTRDAGKNSKAPN